MESKIQALKEQSSLRTKYQNSDLKQNRTFKKTDITQFIKYDKWNEREQIKFINKFGEIRDTLLIANQTGEGEAISTNLTISRVLHIISQLAYLKPNFDSNKLSSYKKIISLKDAKNLLYCLEVGNEINDSIVNYDAVNDWCLNYYKTNSLSALWRIIKFDASIDYAWLYVRHSKNEVSGITNVTNNDLLKLMNYVANQVKDIKENILL